MYSFCVIYFIFFSARTFAYKCAFVFHLQRIIILMPGMNITREVHVLMHGRRCIWILQCTIYTFCLCSALVISLIRYYNSFKLGDSFACFFIGVVVFIPFSSCKCINLNVRRILVLNVTLFNRIHPCVFQLNIFFH